MGQPSFFCVWIIVAGKKAGAINAYQEFLSHFENSTARLPQIAVARAALKRLL